MEEKSNQSKKSEMADVAKELVGWEDNKLLNTLKDLTLRPGEMARAYCNGATDKYFSPIAYFLGVTSLLAYLSSVSGLTDAIIETSLNSFDIEAINKHDKDLVLLKDKMGGFLSFIMSEVGQKIILVPPLLLLTWALYKKYASSIKENSWISLYTLSHASLVSILFLGIWYVTKNLDYYTISTTVAWYLYWIWASKGFYNIGLGKAIWTGTLLFAVYNIMYIAAVSLIAIAVIM